MNRLRNFMLLIFCCCCGIAFAQNDPETKLLNFQISNCSNEKGTVIVRLYRKQDRLPKEPFLKLTGKITGDRCELSTDRLEYGEYAAIAFHDENNNGELDHSWGLPAEQIGFSNCWKLTLLSGMPNFEKLKFIYSAQNNVCTIKLK